MTQLNATQMQIMPICKIHFLSIVPIDDKKLRNGNNLQFDNKTL